MMTMKSLCLSFLVAALLCIFLCGPSAIAGKNGQTVVFDLLQQNEFLTVYAEGLGEIESYRDQQVRWLYGPEAVFHFYSSVDKPAVLSCDLSTPFDEQGVTLIFNGEVVRKFDLVKGDKDKNTLRFEAGFPLRKGLNTLMITSQRWNSGEDAFAKEDTRQMALLLTKCTLALSSAPLPPQPEKSETGLLRSVLQTRRVVQVFEAPRLELEALGIGPAVVGSPFHPAFGHATRFVFFNEASEAAQVDFSLNSLLEGQVACVHINDAPRDCFSLSDVLLGKSYRFQARKGFNEIVVAYAKSEIAIPLDFPVTGHPSANFFTCQIMMGL